jgi:hypothetical protein
VFILFQIPAVARLAYRIPSAAPSPTTVPEALFLNPNFFLNTYFLFLNTDRTRETRNQTQTNLNQKQNKLKSCSVTIFMNPNQKLDKTQQQQKYGSKLSSPNLSFMNCSGNRQVGNLKGTKVT